MFRRYWLFISFILIGWACFHAWILIDTGIDPEIAVSDSLLSNVLLTAIGFALSYKLHYYQPGKTNAAYLFPWIFLLAAIWALSIKWILGYIFAYDAGYLSLLEETGWIRFGIGILTIACFFCIGWISYHSRSHQDDERRNATIEKLAKESELSSLRQQLQPHFLFNTLNSISALVSSRPEEARKMIHQLSDFLRGTLKKEEQGPVLLSEELNHLQLYLDIEKVRFGHRLVTHLDTDEKTLSLKLPPLLLQPLVENAIKFGLYDTLESVTISLITKYESPYLTIEITNPFDPETSQPRVGTGFGLNSVKRKLYLLYARNDLLETRIIDHQFRVFIKIPQL